MSEEGTPVAVHDGMTKAEVAEALANHRREIEDIYQTHRQQLLEEISSLGSSDKEEKDRLKAEVADLKEWKDDQIKAEERRQAAKGDQHTIVTPPENIPPPPATGDQATTHNNNQADRKRGMKGWW